MIRRFFKCQLLTDVILTHGSATEKNVRGLDYIPGGNFRGILGGQYADFGNKAYDLFHSGAVRFYDAHIGTNSFSLAVPFSWAGKKGVSVYEKNGTQEEKPLIAEKLYLPFPGMIDALRPVRSGYFTPRGTYLEPRVNFSMKTAYDGEKMKSRESQMFGYQSLIRGSCFIFPVDFYTDDSAFIEDVTGRLEGEQSIGRCRSAQYGKVMIKKLKDYRDYETYENLTDSGKARENDRHLYLYAESPLSFYSFYGEATLTPTYGELVSSALEDRRSDKREILCPELSRLQPFILSPYNGARQHRDSDRITLAKGSVLVLDTERIGDFNFGDFKERCRRGLGFHLNEGMGKVLINPSFITPSGNDRHPRFVSIEDDMLIETPPSEDSPKEVPGHEEMNDWLQRAIKKKEQEEKILEKFYTFLDKWPKKDGITSSQWRVVREKAVMEENKKKLIKTLFDKTGGVLMTGTALKIWNDKAGVFEEMIKDLEEDIALPVTALFCEAQAKKAQAKDAEKEARNGR